MMPPMGWRAWGIAAGVLAVAGMGGLLFWRGPVAETRQAALKAFPVYSFVRTRNEQLMGIAHVLGADPDAARPRGLGLLVHRDRLATPRDRLVTMPNNDTLYSTAFVALGNPMLIAIPDLPDRYHSLAIMDARTDHAVIAGSRDGSRAQLLLLCAPADRRGACATAGRRDDRLRVIHLPTDEAWVLVRVAVNGAADLDAARAAQAGFSLNPAPEAPFADWPQPPVAPVALPVIPDPATLLRRANPLIARNPALQDPALAATGYGGGPDAFEHLPAWRQWLWRLLWPRIVRQLQAGIAAGSRATGDGWSRSPPGIGTAEASDAVRAAVALGGLAALPADEAVYWSATQDSGGRELDGAHRYRLRIPQPVPAGAFWSLTLYERLPDGRLFFLDNPAGRFAIGSRTPGLRRDADGTLMVTLSADDPGPGANWLPAPRAGPFTLIFRAYLPEAPIRDGAWRLPAVERVP